MDENGFRRCFSLRCRSDEGRDSGMKQSRRAYFALKRGADIVFAALGLVVLALPMLLVAAVVRVDSGRGVIFAQERVGRYGKHFLIYKFRTMNAGGKVTRVGRFLRRASIDELPQLWNILRGDMSFIGYRPVIPAEEELVRLRAEAGVFELRPGLTGLAQVSGRDKLTPAPKTAFDKTYTEQCSVSLDLCILCRTVVCVLRHTDVTDKP